MQPIIHFNENECVNCKLCGKVCPLNFFLMESRRCQLDSEDCQYCYHCYSVCPSNAINIDRTDDVISEKAKEEMFINTGDFKRFLSLRRSVRFFDGRKVENKILQDIINYASYIPSGGNEHSYEFTVIQDKDVISTLKNQVIAFYKLFNMVLNSAVLRFIVKPFLDKQSRAFLKKKDLRIRLKKMFESIEYGNDPIFYNSPTIIFISSAKQTPTPFEDSIIAGYQISLLAQTMGLGSCFVSMVQKVVNFQNKTKKLIGLGKKDTIHAVLIIGHPDVDYIRAKPIINKNINWR